MLRVIRGIVLYVHITCIACLYCRISKFSNMNVVDVDLIRMLVYEYVDNGNLEQWLHGDVGPVSPLTWENRMKIILGTAKGCAPFSLFSLVTEFHCHSV